MQESVIPNASGPWGADVSIPHSVSIPTNPAGLLSHNLAVHVGSGSRVGEPAKLLEREKLTASELNFPVTIDPAHEKNSRVFYITLDSNQALRYLPKFPCNFLMGQLYVWS